MTDFRALCTELLEIVEDEYSGTSCLLELRRSARAALAEAYEAEANNPPEGHPDPEPFQAILRERAAALAQPEPQGPGPTDEELFGLEELRDAWNAQADAMNTWDELGMDEIIWFAQQQALARWGRPAVEPVPVAERLPGPEDCNAEGMCWWWDDDDDMWRLHERRPWLLCWTHWLPHHALPMPQQEAQP